MSFAVAAVLIFLQRSAPHRDLPSFPTRRSSDLGVNRTRIRMRDRPRVSRGEMRNSSSRNRRLDRSEEHTSELQSPDHLVCRLLLEKKKEQIDSYSTILIDKI